MGQSVIIQNYDPSQGIAMVSIDGSPPQSVTIPNGLVKQQDVVDVCNDFANIYRSNLQNISSKPAPMFTGAIVLSNLIGINIISSQVIPSENISTPQINQIGDPL